MATSKKRKAASDRAKEGTFIIRLLHLFVKGPARYFVIIGVLVLLGFTVWTLQRPNQTVTATGTGSVAVMTHTGPISTGYVGKGMAQGSEPAAEGATGK